MKAKVILTSILFLALAFVPINAYAASELKLEARFVSPIMEKEGGQRYEWTLVNESPYDVQSVCLRVDGAVIREMDELESGGSASGWGIIDIADEDFERYICFSADGYSQIPNDDAGIAQKTITRYVESCCNAAASKSAEAEQPAMPAPPELRLPAQAEEPYFELDASAYVQSSLIPSGTENELLVFVKNNGNTDATKLELLLKKETVAQTETLSGGKSLILRCPVKPEAGKAIQPVLRYVNDKGKTLTKKMEKIQFYAQDGLLQISLRSEDESPTPRAETGAHIELKNTGEKTLSGIKLFDMAGNPVQLPASKLKGGQTMNVYVQFQLQREKDIAFYARYSNKQTVVSTSNTVHIVPEIPEGTAGMKLRVIPDKTELNGCARDMVTFTCRLANSGSYPLSGVLLKNGDQVIGGCDVLPAGEEAVFKAAYRLSGTSELRFTASAADETGKPRECTAAVSIPAGRAFQANK